VAHVHSPPKRTARATIPALVTSADEEAQQKIKTLEAELAVAKAAKSKSPEPSEFFKLFAVSSANYLALQTEVSTSARPPKGVSLANPHKKARKYQPVEFESDDDQN
jgi:hypothetical protein